MRRLNDVLCGGLPGRHVYLLQGAPGTGKTTMSLQFLIEGVALGETGLFVTLSQSAYELRTIADAHGWSLHGIEIVELHAQAMADNEQTVFYPIDVRLDATRDAMLAALDEHRPGRMVYDSLVEVRQLSRDAYSFQRELLSLKQLLHERRVAAYFIDLPSAARADVEVESIAHGIVSLDKSLPSCGRARRRIEVGKMRGVEFHDGYHDMNIQHRNGVVVYPRVVPDPGPEKAGGELIRSGVEKLDEMLGGGMEPGTTTLTIGQAGTGKSTLSSLYSHAVLERGEMVAQNVSCLLEVAQNGLPGNDMETPVDVSFPSDTVVLPRLFEVDNAIRRTIAVVKKRHGPHDLNIRQSVLQPGGIVINELPSGMPGSSRPA